MKTKLALSIAALGLLSWQVAHATPYDVISTPIKVTASKTKPKRSVYYITSVSATGSHLPTVVCRYGGQYYSQSPTSVYAQPRLDRTGQLSVAGELIQRDPAISFSTGHR